MLPSKINKGKSEEAKNISSAIGRKTVNASDMLSGSCCDCRKQACHNVVCQNFQS